MPGDWAGVRSGTELSAASVLVGQDSPVCEKGASGLEDADRVLPEHECRCTVVQVRIHPDEPGPDRLN